MHDFFLVNFVFCGVYAKHEMMVVFVISTVWVFLFVDVTNCSKIKQTSTIVQPAYKCK